MTPDQLLERAVVTDPARPLITYYDDATDERAELSVATFANWVAKTANLLVDGLGAQPGQRVSVRLPVHWQGAVWHAACWAVGLVSVTGSGDAGTDIAVVPLDPADTDGPPPAAPNAAEVVGLGLGPMGLSRRDAPVPAHVTLDYDREIHSHGDRFAPRAGDDPDRPALQDGLDLHTAGELAAATADRVTSWALPPGSRVLSTRPYDDLTALLVGLLVPLANGGGTVLCRHLDGRRVSDRMTTERVAAVTGEPADGRVILPPVT